MEIVNAQQTQSKNFLCFDQMPDVTLCKTVTRWTGTTFFNRLFLHAKSGILQVERATSSKRCSISCQPGWQDAVKEVHSPCNQLDQLRRSTQTHRIAWFGLGQIG